MTTSGKQFRTLAAGRAAVSQLTARIRREVKLFTAGFRARGGTRMLSYADKCLAWRLTTSRFSCGASAPTAATAGYAATGTSLHAQGLSDNVLSRLEKALVGHAERRISGLGRCPHEIKGLASVGHEFRVALAA